MNFSMISNIKSPLYFIPSFCNIHTSYSIPYPHYILKHVCIL